MTTCISTDTPTRIACGRKVKYRGLCSVHAQRLARRIKTGEVASMDAAAAQGLCLPATGTGGRPARVTCKSLPNPSAINKATPVPGQCLRAGCSHKPIARGLCMTHWSQVRSYIRHGLLAGWDAATAAGYCAPLRHKGPTPGAKAKAPAPPATAQRTSPSDPSESCESIVAQIETLAHTLRTRFGERARKLRLSLIKVRDFMRIMDLRDADVEAL